MFEVKSFEFLLQAATPIAHHSEVFGNHAVICRRKVRQPTGEWAQVPYVSGDAMRHGLREAAAYAFLDAAGLLDKGTLTDASLRLLFNGGMVSGRGDGANIKLDAYQEMVDLFPPLALLGGCASNRVVPGRIQVEDAVLICEESRPVVPAWCVEEAGKLDSCRAHVEIQQRVRMDSQLDPAKRRLLSPAAQDRVKGMLNASEKASEEDDAIARQDAKSSMMPRTYETVAAGSLFAWRITATCTSDLDADTLHTMIGAFLTNATVGGKRGTGNGKLVPISARGIVVNRPSERMHAVDAMALAPKVGELFRAHVRARADRIAPFLAEVDA